MNLQEALVNFQSPNQAASRDSKGVYVVEKRNVVMKRITESAERDKERKAAKRQRKLERQQLKIQASQE